MVTLTRILSTHIKISGLCVLSCFIKSSETEQIHVPWIVSKVERFLLVSTGQTKQEKPAKAQRKTEVAGKAACGRAEQSERDRCGGVVNSAIPPTLCIETPTAHEWVSVCVWVCVCVCVCVCACVRVCVCVCVCRIWQQETPSPASVTRICQHKHRSGAYYNTSCVREVQRETDGGRAPGRSRATLVLIKCETAFLRQFSSYLNIHHSTFFLYFVRFDSFVHEKSNFLL